MVQEMYGKMKESYEMKMEGGSMDVEGALHEIYGKYQNMSEGNMEPVYDEISELMMYEEDMPLNEVMPFSDEEMETFSRKPAYRKELGSKEEKIEIVDDEEEYYDPFEQFDADNPESGIDEEYLYEDDDMCMECGKSGMYESVKRKLNILKKKNRNRF
jgi:patatin-like phospholipase/acyl hydrolase